MRKFSALQLIGPTALFAVLTAADVAEYALQSAPSCEWLWRLNLGLFDVFQRTHYALQVATGGDYAQAAFIGTPLLFAAAVGVMYKRSMLLALSTNLSFVYILFVAIVWQGFKPTTQASLSGALPTSIRPDVLVLAILLGLSLVSFVASHIVYIAKVRAKPA